MATEPFDRPTEQRQTEWRRGRIPDISLMPPDRLRHEIASLLDLAEGLRADQARSRGRQLAGLLGVQAAAALAGFALIGGACAVAVFGRPASWVAVAGVAVVLAACCFGGAHAWRFAQARARDRTTDRLAMSEAIELLREIEPVLATQYDWSALERLELRIRLSRFGISSEAGRAPK